MDSAAKRTYQSDVTNLPPIQYTLANEMWQFYTGVPEEYMATAKLPPSHKIIEGDKVIKYWTNHFTIPWDAVKEKDWPASEKARANQNFIQRKWATKWAAEKIPTGSEMEDRGAWDNAKCSHKCGEELEDPGHVTICPNTNQLWTNNQHILLQWGAKNAAAPGLMASF
eukprot:12594028-Ditylum_brightwellii.AAC.1